MKIVRKKSALPSKRFRLVRKSFGQPATEPEQFAPGIAVAFEHEGKRMVGKSLSVDRASGKARVKIAVPARGGSLALTEAEMDVPLSSLSESNATIRDGVVKRFELGIEVKLAADTKALEVLDPEGRIVDYKDLYIEGYASTFVETTAADRSGDYILKGAFDETLADFKKNPVILIDHRNEVKYLAGSWERLSVNAQGLAVRGKISNAPELRDLRFKLVEGHLKGLSIGGFFHYLEDRRGIDQIDLFEISIVAVPANQDALMAVRSVRVEDCTKAMEFHARHGRTNFGQT